MIKLVVLDVDGTITDQKRIISTNVIIALRKIMDSNVIVSLVSGNVIPAMYALKIFLGINGPVLGENGGIMLDENDITTYFSMEKPKVFFDYISKKTSATEIITNRWRESSVGFQAEDEDIPKIAEEAVNYEVDIVSSGFSWHILNKGQNKGFGLKVLKEKLNIADDEILVIGDSDNDISMFINTVHRATMSNGTDMLKEKSEYVSDLSNGDGLVDILNHFRLI